MQNIPLNVLALFGLFLNIVGAFLLAMEALGASELLDSLKNEREQGLRMTQIGYYATLNQLLFFVLLWLISFFVLLIVLPKPNLVPSLLVAPFVYFVWKFIVILSELLYKIVDKAGPKKYIRGSGFFALFRSLVLSFFWVVIFSIVTLFWMVVKFGVKLPLVFFSEKLIAPRALDVFARIAEKDHKERRFHVKSRAIYGIALLLLGFIYQGVSLALQLVPELFAK